MTIDTGTRHFKCTDKQGTSTEVFMFWVISATCNNHFDPRQILPITIAAHEKYTHWIVLDVDEPLTMHNHQEDILNSKCWIVVHGVDNVRYL